MSQIVVNVLGQGAISLGGDLRLSNGQDADPHPFGSLFQVGQLGLGGLLVPATRRDNPLGPGAVPVLGVVDTSFDHDPAGDRRQ
ncbi:MAG TPA: hypothetical protein VKE40_18380 [Gemmataceae bacterium]|nr:hypothetical protein [Gemmataceae bacterium]